MEILKRFRMLESHEVNNPIVLGSKLSKDADGVVIDELYYKQIIGSLMYLMSTCLNLVYIVSLISKYMAIPT